MLKGYFAQTEQWLTGGESRSSMPTCHAGEQTFNIDHVGAVSACIERIDESVGTVKTQHIRDLLALLRARHPERAHCQDCWTLCRGVAQELGHGASVSALIEMGVRMRTT